MPKLREIRDCLLLGHNEEFLFLYNINQSKNPDFPYSVYDSSDLDKLTDHECMAGFQFLKGNICDLKEVLGILNEIRCYNRLVVNGIEALHSSRAICMPY